MLQPSQTMKYITQDFFSTIQGIFNCLTGAACASPVKKIAPPMFQTCPPKILLNVRRFIISLNF